MTIRPISKELQAKAAAELNEDPKRIQNDLKYLKEWLTKQPHIKARTEDQWLLTFLRGCKFSLERTKEKLDMFYTVRTIAVEYFHNRDPFLPEIQEILSLGLILPLPKTKGPDSPRVLLTRVPSDPAKIKLTDIFKVNLMVCDILLNEDDQFIICGMEMIQDMQGTTVAHMTSMTPTIAKTAMTIFQEAYPTRPKAFHQCNTPSFYEMMFNIMKPFLREKFLKRMIIHPNDKFEEVYDAIPKSILPKEYGGDDRTVKELTEHWKKKVESYGDWYQKDSKYRTNEAKRVGTPKTTNNVFGVEGSFRKLDVD